MADIVVVYHFLFRSIARIFDDARHAGFHVVEVVAVQHPFAGFVGEEFYGSGGVWGHVDGVFPG